jgi:lysophospholipase L1-like esterase
MKNTAAIKSKMTKHRMTHVDLAFPSVVINPNSWKKARLRRRRTYFRFLVIIFLCVLLLLHVIDRTILRLPMMEERRVDMSHVKSIQDLTVDNIDSWCLHHDSVGSVAAATDPGDDHDTCPCSNPLHPEGRSEDLRWEKVHHNNVDKLKAADLQTLDVIFLGDSITEGWSGSFYNKPDKRVEGSRAVFQSLFSKANGAKYEGIHLGIAGDVTSELLWRIQNGEMPLFEPEGRLKPLVIWVLIGTNDIGNKGCSVDMVILGVIRVIEELLLQQPLATIVINGILPRTFESQGFLMHHGNDPKKPVLWPHIQIINRELSRYAQKRGPEVVYFETLAFFRNATATSNELRIDQDLM